MRVLRAAGCLTPVAIVAYAAVGLLLLSQFGGTAFNYFASAGWTQVPGTIVTSDVTDEWDTTGDRYAIELLYTYEVDGTTYEGDQLNLRGTIFTGNREDAEQLIAPYPSGTAVTPYVNPSDPTQAVLTRELPNTVLGIAATGVILILLSLALTVRYVMTRQEKTPANK